MPALSNKELQYRESNFVDVDLDSEMELMRLAELKNVAAEMGGMIDEVPDGEYLVTPKPPGEKNVEFTFKARRITNVAEGVNAIAGVDPKRIMTLVIAKDENEEPLTLLIVKPRSDSTLMESLKFVGYTEFMPVIKRPWWVKLFPWFND